ncbi:MAG: F0F1 ATP synthase subunit A [bacterium]
MHVHFGLTWLHQFIYCGITTVVILLFTYFMNKNKTKDKLPGWTQNIAEMVVELLEGLIAPELGHDKLPYILPFLGTFFFFILISNLFLIIPNTHPPTSDWSNTLALALILVVSLQYYNIKINGPKKAAKLWFDPIPGLKPQKSSEDEPQESRAESASSDKKGSGILWKVFVIPFFILYFIDNFITLGTLSFSNLMIYCIVGSIVIIVFILWAASKLKKGDLPDKGAQSFAEWMGESLLNAGGINKKDSPAFKKIIGYCIGTLFFIFALVLMMPVFFTHTKMMNIVSIYSLVIIAFSIVHYLYNALSFHKALWRAIWPYIAKTFIFIFDILKAIPAKILIVLFIALHVLDNGARILSLSLRLFGNIFGEHTVLMMVTDVALKNYFYVIPLVIPFLIFCMDVLFALIQTAVFIMLSNFYFKEELGVH